MALEAVSNKSLFILEAVLATEKNFIRELGNVRSSFDPFIKYNTIPRPELDTCDWISSDYTFATWFEGKDAYRWLWIHGSPGSGKSVILKYIVRLLQERSLANTSGKATRGFQDVITFLFCDAKVTEQEGAPLVLRYILSQILNRRPHLLQYIEPKPEGIEDLSPSQLVKWLSDITLRARRTRFWIVLDALDELPQDTADTLLNSLRELLNEDTNFRLHILVSNRQGVAPNLSGQADSICLNTNEVRDKVQLFIDHKIRNMRTQCHISEAASSEVRSRITTLSNSNFLFASLSWRKFSEGVSLWTPTTIRKKLDELTKLPLDFDTLYVYLLEQVPSDFQSALKKIFMLLLVARRPLSIDDMHFAVTMNNDHRSFQQVKKDLAYNFHDILQHHCSTFLVLDNYVQFYHHSFREFLLRSRSYSDDNLIHQLRPSMSASEYFACLTCQRILGFEDWTTWEGHLTEIQEELDSTRGITGSNAVIINTPGFPLLLYAVQYLSSHLEYVQDEFEFVEFVAKMFSTRRRIRFTQLYSRLQAEMTELGRILHPILTTDCPPLDILIQLGDFVVITKRIIQMGQNPNELDPLGRSPLYWAILKSRKRITGFLLANRAVNPNLGHGDEDKPIHIATNNAPLLKMLVSCDRLDINCRGSKGRTALHTAISQSPQSAHYFDILLEHPDINLSMRDTDGVTPFILALSRSDGLWAAMRLLECPKEKLDISATDRNGTNALALACIQCRAPVRQELISRDRSQMFTIGKDELNVLTRSAYHGRREQLISLLNDLPDSEIARLSTAGNFNLMSLCAQQDWGDLVVILRTGFGLETKEPDKTRGRTTLHWAVYSYWNPEAADLSETETSLVNVQDFDGCTPLHLAIEHRNLTAARSFLQSGASILIKNKYGKTPVHVAAECGCRPMMELFLDGSIREFGRDKFGASLLHYMVTWEWNSLLLSFLRIKRPLVNVRDYRRRTPLHYAAIFGNTAAILMLLEHGADIDPRDDIGFTPVFYAIREGNYPLVRSLFDKGANLRRRDAFHRTAADIASGQSSELNTLFRNLGLPVSKQRRMMENEDVPVYKSKAAFWSNLDGMTVVLADHRRPLGLKPDLPPGEISCDCDPRIGRNSFPFAKTMGWTTLQRTIISGHIHCAEACLRSGCDVAEVNFCNGWNAFHLAACTNETSVTMMMLKYDRSGAFDAQSPDGTPAIVAARRGRAEVLLILLQNGAVLSKISPTGFTILHMATLAGDLHSMKAIVARRVDLVKQPAKKHDILPLHIAAAEQNLDALQYLLGFYSPSSTITSHQRVALFFLSLKHCVIREFEDGIAFKAWAIPKEIMLEVKEVLDSMHCSNPVWQYIHQCMPQFLSINMEDILKFIFQIRPEFRTTWIRSCVLQGMPTSAIASFPQYQMTGCMLNYMRQHGIDPLVTFAHGSNVLHRQFQGTFERMEISDINDCVDTIKALIALDSQVNTRKGASLFINAPNRHGETPLHVALSNCTFLHHGSSIDVITALVDAGADLYLRRADGLNALDIARMNFPDSWVSYRVIRNAMKSKGQLGEYQPA